VPNPLATVLAYHEATKHHLTGYARGPGYLDWATQPDPFRRYAGAPLVPLAREALGDDPPYGAVWTEGALPPRKVDADAVGRLLFDSLALSAWKEAGGNRWALRVNPSSGNLHPTEGYVACGPEAGLADAPAVFHYAPAVHALELRHRVAPEAWDAVARALPPGALLVGLAAIPWREAWKYGERAFRYCQHDAGHAVAAVALAAAALGWRCRLLDGAGDDAITALLGLDPAGPEGEHPDALLAVFPPPPEGTPLPAPHALPEGAAGAAAAGEWLGTPNVLSPSHVAWSAVDRAVAATAKPRTPEAAEAAPGPAPEGAAAPPRPEADAGFRVLAHRRRSAVAMDGVTGMTAAAFYGVLGRTLPGPGRVPFAALPGPAAVHLGLFVHRVAGVAPGLYVLARDGARVPLLRAALAEPDFAWRRPPGCPEELALFALVEEDVTRLAGVLACRQQIASHGTFAVAMLAEFEGPLTERGAWMYRRLFWEAGAVGQVLYLEAEAAGLKGTGIGCYFDDPVHRAFGLRDRTLQCLYEFTMGGPVEDPRLGDLPAYPEAEGV